VCLSVDYCHVGRSMSVDLLFWIVAETRTFEKDIFGLAGSKHLGVLFINFSLSLAQFYRVPLRGFG